MTRVVAVTGASGFLGRELVACLAADGVRVRAVSRHVAPWRDGVEWIRTDIRDVPRLTTAFRGVDAVFHLAAHVHDLQSADDTAAQESITLGGTLATLAAAEHAGVGAVVFASSLAVFGPVGTALVDEGHPCRPDTPYGRAKRDAEEAVVAFASRTGASASCIRPAMLYGVHCPGNLPRLIRAVRAPWFPALPEFGNRRSMVSAHDAARAMVLAWHAAVHCGRPFIVTDGQGYSTRELVEMIRRALGHDAPRLTIPPSVFNAAARLGDLGRAVLGRRVFFDSQALDRLAGSAYFDSARARAELGFVPSTTLAEVMPALVREVTRASVTSAVGR
jgi:nucleoside-diphosphate-sugar epimerase